MKRRMIVALMALCSTVFPFHASRGAPQIGATSVFTMIARPGSPEGIVVHNGVVYVGTHTTVLGNGGGPPSKIYRFAVGNAAPLGAITIQGQDTSITHGILGMKIGPDGALYVVDQNPGRILRIDLVSNAQTTYATIPELGPCVISPAPCSPGLFSIRPSWTNDLAFAPDGSAYVTDLQASTIFRVPPGGGAAAIWYQDARFDSVFGLNGIVVNPAGNRLFFAMTASVQPATLLQGIIYSLPLVAAPQKADLKVFHTFTQPIAGPDGIDFGASGRLYVVLAGSNQISILGPNGTALATFPNPIGNQLQPVPFDAPANLAFDGAGNILITNHAFFTGLKGHWAVLRTYVNDGAA